MSLSGAARALLAAMTNLFASLARARALAGLSNPPEPMPKSLTITARVSTDADGKITSQVLDVATAGAAATFNLAQARALAEDFGRAADVLAGLATMADGVPHVSVAREIRTD